MFTVVKSLYEEYLIALKVINDHILCKKLNTAVLEI